MNPRFYFSTCQVGAEKAVKAEVLSEHPQLRFSFSRPGFVTFKEPGDALPSLTLKKGIFTRLWGEALGQATDNAALKELLAAVPRHGILQCFDRDEYLPGDEPRDFLRHGRIRAILEGERGLDFGSLPVPGFEVYSLVWIDDFRVFLTRHVHSEFMSTSPGNIPAIPLPEEAPSRSFLKIEEAIDRFKPPIRKNLEVLEVGCAPGGATMAMLDRGMRVTGVDPQHMDARILARSGFVPIRKMARYLVADELRSVNPDWLVMDMNIAPPEALAELSHVVATLRSVFAERLRLGQGFLTLKLNDWSFARDIPLYLERLEKIGFHDLHPVQLCANRREFFVWASRFD
jgi:23S rRNA (cytidine2498-2'-O)-methyltransferase